jgi:3-phenylpropionate/cinnamic acid dioxygenase small subunit
MSSDAAPGTLNPKTLLEIARDVITREVVFLDERRWDEWVALYASDCEYWVPTWVTEDRLAADPGREITHIYNPDRRGLEDRIARIRTGKSPSTVPLRRTAHTFANLMITAPGDRRFGCRTTWTCHVYDPHSSNSYVLFGHAQYELALAPEGWKIARKKTVLQNDTLPSMVDVYCL